MAKGTASNGFVAICDGTADTIFGYGKTEEEATTNLWSFVHDYLVKADAPETQDYAHKELEDYFGHSVFKLSAPAGFTRT